MTLTITEERYQQIRQKVLERRLMRLVDEARRSGTKTFQTVDEFMAFLDTLVASDPPTKPPRKRRES